MAHSLVVDDYTLGPAVASTLVGDVHPASAPVGDGRVRQVAVTLCSATRCKLDLRAAEALLREVHPAVVRYEAIGGPGAYASRADTRATLQDVGGASAARGAHGPPREALAGPEARRHGGWMASDLVRREPLEAAIEGTSVVERVRVARTVAEALAALHARGVVHGHLNPTSVVLRREPTGALAPLVVEVGARPLLDHGAQPWHHRPEVALQLYPFLAPEAVEPLRAGRAPDPPADVHALGALLAALLTGRAPGTLEGEETPEAILRSKARRRHLVAATLDPDELLDLQGLNDLLARCLAPRPADRPSAAEAAAALAACLDRHVEARA